MATNEGIGKVTRELGNLIVKNEKHKALEKNSGAIMSKAVFFIAESEPKR